MKFILADPLLNARNCLYYNYATYCLRAAAKRGYEPILATSADYCLGGFPPKTFPVYTYGAAFELSLSDAIQRVSTGTEIWYKALRKIPHVMDKRVTNTIVRRYRSLILQFARETSNLLAGMRLDKDDVVFFPTANLVMVLGICDYVKKNPRNAAACWCFLVKPPPPGSPYGNSQDLTPYAIRLFRSLFSRLAAADMRAFFFTDSEQLTGGYDRIAPGLFRVAPIPHTAPKPEASPAHDMITITYMGHARTQKGYKHLPEIIGKLQADRVTNGKIRFLIQSHINSAELPELEPVRDLLESLGPEVSLTHELQTNEEYWRMLGDSDIMLLPYSPERYFAQTSGICAEALAGGIPVVVPGGTWLARQFARVTYKYQDGFGKSLPLGECAVGCNGERTDLPCRGASHIRVKAVFGDNNTAPFFQALVTQEGEGGNILAEDVAVLDRVALQYATCLFTLEKDAARLRVGIRHIAKGTTLDLRGAEATLFDEDPASPRSAVGMIYGTVRSIPDCLKNMISNYAHYQDSARVFSDAYYAQHNADSLIDALTTKRLSA